jgi:hypothetical protein
VVPNRSNQDPTSAVAVVIAGSGCESGAKRTAPLSVVPKTFDFRKRIVEAVRHGKRRELTELSLTPTRSGACEIGFPLLVHFGGVDPRGALAIRQPNDEILQTRITLADLPPRQPFVGRSRRVGRPLV